jgi:hypothetical protein
MNYTNSYDNKIMTYSGDNWEEFVAMFTSVEIEEMRKERSIYYTALPTGTKEELIKAYVEEWAVAQIRDRVHSGTEQLLRLLYNVIDE